MDIEWGRSGDGESFLLLFKQSAYRSLFFSSQSFHISYLNENIATSQHIGKGSAVFQLIV